MTQHRRIRTLVLLPVCLLSCLYLLGQATRLGRNQLPALAAYLDTVQSWTAQQTHQTPIKFTSAATPTANGEIGFDGTNLKGYHGGAGFNLGSGGGSGDAVVAGNNTWSGANTFNFPISLGTTINPTVSGQVGRDGSGFLFKQGSDSLRLNTGTTILSETSPGTTITNSATETTLYSATVPGGTLSTGNKIRLTLLCTHLRNTTTVDDPVIRIKYGGTTLATVNAVGTSQSASTRGAYLSVDLYADGATNAQRCSAFYSNASNTLTNTGYGTSAVDSTVDQTLLVSWQWANADTGLSITSRHATVEKHSSGGTLPNGGYGGLSTEAEATVVYGDIDTTTLLTEVTSSTTRTVTIPTGATEALLDLDLAAFRYSNGTDWTTTRNPHLKARVTIPADTGSHGNAYWVAQSVGDSQGFILLGYAGTSEPAANLGSTGDTVRGHIRCVMRRASSTSLELNLAAKNTTSQTGHRVLLEADKLSSSYSQGHSLRIVFVGSGGAAVADAAVATKGLTKLSSAPASATNPIAVGDNDTRLNPVPSAAGGMAYDTGSAYGAVGPSSIAGQALQSAGTWNAVSGWTMSAPAFGQAPGVGAYSNLVVKYAGVTNQVTVTADSLTLTGTGVARVANSVSLTLDISTSGANGLDTGTEAASTWYSVWVIGSSTMGIAGLFSLSTTTPTLPTNYFYKRRVGWVRNDASSNLRPTRQAGVDAWYLDAGVLVLDQGAASTFTAVDASASVPPTALGLHAWDNTGTGVGSATEARSEYADPDQGALILFHRVYTNGASMSYRVAQSFVLPLNAAQKFSYRCAVASNTLDVTAAGWRDGL